MAQLFAVMRTRGPAWNCWSVSGLLQTLWIKPWWLRLGTIVGTPASSWGP